MDALVKVSLAATVPLNPSKRGTEIVGRGRVGNGAGRARASLPDLPFSRAKRASETCSYLRSWTVCPRS